uniref:Large terminase n=1 Tax=Myoviridae sp. ctrf010 TaxID=2825182 RepID=A0A8S5P1Q4_9CAUD|nr:MAG TPA: large terminase [Myoviridae sp. ctrf010]
MARIMNPDYIEEPRLFRNEWKNDEVDRSQLNREFLTNEAGGLRKEIEDNMQNLALTAKQTLRRRKPITDWKTTNKSFLNMYNTLHKLGIKNNKFFLRLYDRDLSGVDVYNTTMPKDLQLKIILECIINPWYFLREVCRIPVDGKPIEPGGGVAFIADRNNIASWYCFLNGIDHYDSKSRQLGKTQNAVAQLNYAFHFGAMSATMLFFSKDFPLAKQNLYRLKCQRDMLPKWMQMRIAFKDDGSIDKGQDNVTTMRNPITNNVIKVMPKATSQDAAVKLGRGETSSFYWNDEYDFTPFNNEIMDAAAFAYSTARENAKNNKSLFGRILTSTPGYLNTQAGKDAEKRIQRMLQWDDHMYDEPINKIHSRLNSNKCNGYMYIEHTWKQLGKSLDWYKNQCKLVDYDGDKILREIELQRIQGNELSPFKKQALVFIAQNKKTPIEKIKIDKELDPILQYEKFNKKITYILSVDPSEGLALNNNAFTLINPHTQMIAAEYKSPYISPPDFFRMICAFIKNYGLKVMIVIESNRGRELINRFLESQYRFMLWYDEDKLTAKAVKNVDQYGAERQAANARRSIGFDTTKSTKPLLFSIIERFMEEELEKVNTEYLVKDVACVQRKPNGAIIMGVGDDDEGEGHGDILMAYLIGLFVLFNAKNLEEFGIHPGASEPEDPDRELTMEEQRIKIQSVMGDLPPEMQEIFKDYMRQTDPVESSQKYQKQIQMEMEMQEAAMRGTDEYFNPGMNRFIDPGQQDDLWRSTNEAIMEGYNSGRSDPSRMFNAEDWV